MIAESLNTSHVRRGLQRGGVHIKMFNIKKLGFKQNKQPSHKYTDHNAAYLQVMIMQILIERGREREKERETEREREKSIVFNV